ncbi:MAG: Peptidase [Frankiales bacterium]|nr:Peptidase [Frankiales bacterium]
MRRLVLMLVLLLTVPASAAPRPGFGWPLAGPPVVDRGFDPPATAYGAGHRGVDLQAVVGQPVLAAGAGRISYAGLLAGRGVVTVTHLDGLRTTYEPLAVTVRVGQVVARGAVLGQLSTGHASCRSGTHCLHWGLLRGDAYLDPLSLVVTGRVRLLPLGTVAAPPLSPSAPVEVARAEPSGGWNGPVRSAGAVAAAGALLLGISLLTRRPVRPAPLPPPGGSTQPPVDLVLERRRRRAA